ncbi:MAG: T9SS type A sorting domain-containing protein, partial [Candidatus Kapabacteria bacterium]|nr:T9SS type A sorting domain-containing protein [Candidatus Kapabacteria bacterium]
DTKYDFAFKNKFGVISDEYEHLMINTAAENETIPDAVAKNTSPYYGIVILPGDVFEIFAAELSNLKTLLWDNGTKGVFTPGHAAAITHSVDAGVDIALLGAMTAFELDKTAVLSSLGLELKGQTYHGYDFWNIDVYDYDVVGISGDPISGKLGYVTSCLQAQLIPICSITNKKTTSAFIRCAEEDWLKVGEERYILAAKDATFGFRYEKGEQKVVYMTESPSLFINEQKSAELTEKILDYLSDFISVEEFDNTVRNIKAAPNPFAATTTVEFSMFSAAVAEMSIVDVYGNLTEDLGSKLLPAGRNTETINFRYPASGVYFFLVKSAGQTQQIKLIISK